MNKTIFPACLVVGLLGKAEHVRTLAVKKLDEQFGPFFYLSSPLPFTATSYYAEEMGETLNRRLLAFDSLINMEQLPSIKHWCMGLEKEFMVNNKRTINIDPGLLSTDSFILASTKKAAHRLPMGENIFGELTLLWQNGAYEPLSWTYPDYATVLYREIISGFRNRHLWRLQQQGV